MTRLDGNALAGIFADALGVEITTALGRCHACARILELARALAFATDMGAVMRCPDCHSALAILVVRPRDVIVNLTGLSYITVPAR